MKTVVVDGIEYVPKAAVISAATMSSLREAYALAFIESAPDCDCVHAETMRKICGFMREAFRELSPNQRGKRK